MLSVMAKNAKKGEVVAGESVAHCFVCDVEVTGRYYTLATCRTQSTRMRLIEKLGQLVGERYMVVISEEDIICRGCANLINTLDRLESEMGSVRNVVLRFLEKKYSLDEGELVNDKSTGQGLPPQITPAPPRNVEGTQGMKPLGSENFMCRKRKAALSDLENERENGVVGINKRTKKDSKNEIWMQCDKCKYTTHYNAFMIHHIRQHIKKKNLLCDYCGEEVNSTACAQRCGPKNAVAAGPSNVSAGTINSTLSSTSNGKKNVLVKSKEFTKEKRSNSDSEPETIEMIAAEISEFSRTHRTPESPDVVISTVHAGDAEGEACAESGNSILPVNGSSMQVGGSDPLADGPNEMTIEVSSGMGQRAEAVQQVMSADDIQVEMADGEGGGSAPTAICVMEMSEENSADEPTLLTVQKMEDDSNAVYVQVVEMGKGMAIREAGNVTKQVLTVAEDGTVEMVEVMWDEMVTPDVNPEQGLEF